MFLFGGSSVIVLGEKDRWQVAPKIIENTNQGLETYVKMGQSLGSTR